MPRQSARRWSGSSARPAAAHRQRIVAALHVHAVGAAGLALYAGHTLDVDDCGAMDPGKVGIGEPIDPRREGRGREGRGAVREVKLGIVSCRLDKNDLGDADEAGAAALFVEKHVVVPKGVRGGRLGVRQGRLCLPGTLKSFGEAVRIDRLE